jgi:sulfatase modifying factor 1
MSAHPALSTPPARARATVLVATLVSLLASLLVAMPARPLAAQSLATSPLVDRVPVGKLLFDRTEITIAQFARFAQATGTVTRAERDGGGFEYVGGWQRRAGWTWRTPDGVASASQQLPAVHLTHAEAEAYCRWAGGRLPTAAEWISAAYTEQRAAPPAPFRSGTVYPYPTGANPQGANTNGTDPWPRAAPVDATTAAVNGLHDMGANAWEWVSDAQGNDRRTMGGSWWYGADQMRAEINAWKAADFYAVYIGFRCAAPVN